MTLKPAARRRFRAAPNSVAAVRTFVRDAIVADGLDPDCAELLVSELATNAVVHAGTDYEVAVSVSDGVVRVEVTDYDIHNPRLRTAADSSQAGRGLLVVDQLAVRWGSEPFEDGKVVWFEAVAASPSDGDRQAL